MNLRVALIKVFPVKFDLDGNHRRLRQALDAVAATQPDVVVTPEAFLDGYITPDPQVTPESLRDYAVVPETSPSVQAVAAWAAEHRAWVILGCSRLAEPGVYNSALIFNRAGQLAGIYDKVHCRDTDRKYVAGTSLPVFASDFGPFGVMICADRRWPETVRTLALRGARIIFNPTYGEHDEMNAQLLRTRSFESEVFITFTHPTQSLVTDPRGRILLDQTNDEELYGFVELDLSEVDRLRAGPSFLKDRRPDAYSLD